MKSAQSSKRKMLLPSGCLTQLTQPGWTVSFEHFAWCKTKSLSVINWRCHAALSHELCEGACMYEDLISCVSCFWRESQTFPSLSLKKCAHSTRHTLSLWEVLWFVSHACLYVSVCQRSGWSDLWWRTKRKLWIHNRSVHFVFTDCMMCLMLDFF